MKIRSVELTDFRKFVGTVRVDSIGDHVNVLVGRNELGKSTLLEAINGVIFHKARSTAGEVRAFRHFVNGTVPEVKLAFDIDGKSWTIHKRFAGQAGRAHLASSDGRVFQDEAAEVELQRLLGFTGGRGGGEPGIWGTLWVQQGQSFDDAELNEQAQRTIQGCLETQVGLVTGGARGQKIPKAVREALDEIRSPRQREPRGKFKEAAGRLSKVTAEITELEDKARRASELLADLARSRRDLKEAQGHWDEAARRAELDRERTKRAQAAARASEIARVREAAMLTRERASSVHKLLDDRRKAAHGLATQLTQLSDLEGEASAFRIERDKAREALEAAERALAELRAQIHAQSELSRRLERIRAAAALNVEIGQGEAILERAAALDDEAIRLSELIGSIAADDEAVRLIEEAVTEVSKTEAAVNAVATTVSLAIEDAALGRVSIDDQPLTIAAERFVVLRKMTIAVQEIGSIIIEPQIGNRTVLLEQREAAEAKLKAGLEAAGVNDLAAARGAAAHRKEHERRLAEVRKELAGLAPGSAQKRLQPGLDALKSRLGELRGRLKSELQVLKLAELPEDAIIARETAKAHDEASRLAAELAGREAALSGLKDVSARSEKELRLREDRTAQLKGAVEARSAALAAARASQDDVALAAAAAALEHDAAAKEGELAARQSAQGDSVEAIDVRIKRLEAAAENERRAVDTLIKEVTRLEAWAQASEGAGTEEVLLARQAERDHLAAVVASFEEEASVLQLLLDTLETAEREAKNRYLAPIVERVQPYLKMLIPSADIVLDENLRITGLQREGQTEDFDALSGGTREQLAVLTRIAFAELLLDQNRPATVILDDALAFSDDERIESMFDVLVRAGEKVQIIVLTCRKRLFARLGAAPLELRKAG